MNQKQRATLTALLNQLNFVIGEIEKIASDEDDKSANLSGTNFDMSEAASEIQQNEQLLTDSVDSLREISERLKKL